MADSAFLNPESMADFTSFPMPISSRIRAKMMTFASTAIPMERIIPAIPGRESVISYKERMVIIKREYTPKAKDAARPGIRYITIIKIITMISPTMAALKDVESASLPRVAPTTRDSNSFNVTFNPPIRI